VQPNQKEAVYVIDGKTGKVEKVTDDMFKPNGLCFSPDYKKLYIADTGAATTRTRRTTSRSGTSTAAR
jgi:gluconolactonase